MAKLYLVVSIFNLFILYLVNGNQSEKMILPTGPRPTIPPIKNCRDNAWCKKEFKRYRCFDNTFRTEGCPYSCYQCELCGDNFKFCNTIKSWCSGGITPILGDAFAMSMLPHCRKTCSLCSTTTTTKPSSTTTGFRPTTSKTTTGRPPTTTSIPPTTTPINREEFECLGEQYEVVKIEKTVADAEEFCKINSKDLISLASLKELECLRGILLEEIDNRTTTHIWRTKGSIDPENQTWSWNDDQVPFKTELFFPFSTALENHGNCIALKYLQQTQRIEIIGYNCITPRHSICKSTPELKY